MRADEIAGRREKVALALLARSSVRNISAWLGVPPTTIHRDIKAIRVQWRRSQAAAIDEAASEDLQRLASLEAAIWPAATKGDVQAIASVLRIMERRSRLLGLDAPERLFVDLAERSREIADELGLDADEVLAEAQRIFGVLDRQGRGRRRL